MKPGDLVRLKSHSNGKHRYQRDELALVLDPAAISGISAEIGCILVLIRGETEVFHPSRFEVVDEAR